jgi:hypothetical protein
MLRAVKPSRSTTPVVSRPSSTISGLRRSVHDSVSRQPAPSGCTSYAHSATRRPAALTSKANSPPGTQRVMVERVDHRRRPLLLRPRKPAPTAGPLAPPDQVPPVASGLNAPIPGRSLTSAHTRSGGAATEVLREITCGAEGMGETVDRTASWAMSRWGVCAACSARGIMPVMPSLAVPSRAVLAVLLALPLAGCGGEEPVASGARPVLAQPDNPSVASSVADPTSPRIVSIVVTEGRRTGDTGVVELEQNVPVRLSVISDRTDTLVVQGLDLNALATAEVPVQLDFIADRTGEFPVVLQDSGLELTRLRVS